MKGKFNLDNTFDKIASEHLFISEITLAELKYGVEKSDHVEKNKEALENFLTGVQIIPIIQSLDIYAKEKARLRKAVIIIDDFDLLIGSTAITYNLILVTNNTNHFERINGVQLEDWTKLE